MLLKKNFWIKSVFTHLEIIQKKNFQKKYIKKKNQGLGFKEMRKLFVWKMERSSLELD